MKKILAFLLILTACQPIHLVIDQPVQTSSRAIGWQDMYSKYNYRDSTTFDVMSEFEDGARIGDYKTGSDVVVLDSVTTDGTNIYFYTGATILTAVPGVGSAAWGTISGTLTNQVDLTTALGLKANLNSPTFTGTVGGITAAMVGAMSTSHAANAITGTNITNWNTAYGWGDPSGLYAALVHTHVQTSIVGLPDSLLARYTKTQANTLLNLKANTTALANYVPITRTVNGHALNANISVTASDVSLGNLTNKAQVELEDSSAVAEPNSYATGNMLEDGLALKLNVANPTATGTLTTPILKVGNSASNTVGTIDSIGYVGDALAFYDGADTINIYETYAGRIDLDDAIAASNSGEGIFNVLDYGADPTGATESTTAIQAALNAANGNIVYIPAGYYVTGTLVVADDSITIMGAGRYNTILKLKDAADAGTAHGHLIYAGGANKFTLRDIQLDGNGLNQTKIDNRGGTNKSWSVGVFANDTTISYEATNNLKVENCYIHDFARDGIVWSTGTNALVKDCYFKNNFVAQVEFWGATTNGVIDNCYMRNGTGVSLFGDNHTISDTKFEYFYNAHMWDATDYGITLESATYGPDNVMITDCIFKGDTLTEAIFTSTNGMRNLTINNILIKSTEPDHYGIYMVKDTNTLITNSHIIGTKYPIITLGSQWATISNNHIEGNASGYSGIYINGDSDNNSLMGNYIKMAGGRPIELASGATNNVVANNVLTGAWSDALVLDAGTTTTVFNNYSSTISSKVYDKVGNMLNTGTITDATGITVAMLNEFMYYDEAAATDISSNPQIVDGRNGQRITIIGSSDVNTLTLDDGTGLALTGQCVLGSGDSITLAYSSGLDIWVEISRSNN